jgi:hypothetical protein
LEVVLALEVDPA